MKAKAHDGIKISAETKVGITFPIEAALLLATNINAPPLGA